MVSRDVDQKLSEKRKKPDRKEYRKLKLSKFLYLLNHSGVLMFVARSLFSVMSKSLKMIWIFSHLSKIKVLTILIFVS